MSSMFLRPFFVALAVLNMSVFAFAQLELPPAPKPPVVNEKDIPEVAQPLEDARQSFPYFFVSPANAIETLFNEYQAEQELNNKKRAAFLDRLRGFGLSSRATALKALYSPHGPSVDIAAEILEWVGMPEDAIELVSAASVAQDMQAVSQCLDSAAKLGNGKLPILAVNLLDHPKRQVRTTIESRLSVAMDMSYLPKLLQLLQFGRDQDLRLRAARLLAIFKNSPEARQGLRLALKDRSVNVAMQAVTALVGEGTSIEVNSLSQEFLEAKDDIEAAYLLYGLLQVQQSQSELILDEEIVNRLRSLINRQDIFISAVASAAFSEFFFRSELNESMLDLEKQVLFNLVRAVGGVEFYLQYARFSEVALNALRRITGVSFFNQPNSAWLDWYQKNYKSTRLVRGRIDIDVLQLPGLEVSFSTREKAARVLCGSSVPYKYGSRVLGPVAQSRLLASLNKYGLLKASMRPGDLGLSTAPLVATIEISVGEQRKVLRFRGSAGEPWLSELLNDLNTLYLTTGWQTLASRGEAGHAFIMKYLFDFDSELIGSGERGRTFLELSSGRMIGLDPEALKSWLKELHNLSNRELFWTPNLSKELLDVAKLYLNDVELAMDCFNLALTGQHPEVFIQAIDVAMSFSLEAQEVACENIFKAYPLESHEQALRDRRSLVRLMAVQSLPRFGDAALPVLIFALKDSDNTILHACLDGLGVLGSSGVLGEIEPFVGAEYDEATRVRALKALGKINAPSSLLVIEEALRDFSTSVKISALESISAIDGEESFELLRKVFPDFAGTPLESSYQRALFTRGAAATRNILRPYLLSENNLLAKRSTLQVGMVGEPAATPVLIANLLSTPRSTELLDALVSCTGVDFRKTPDPAGTYRAWWSAQQETLPRDWLRNSLVEKGFELDQYFDDPLRCEPSKACEQLLAALISGPPRLRPLVCYFLYTISNVDAQVILPGTPESELLRRAQPWQEFLNEIDGA